MPKTTRNPTETPLSKVPEQITKPARKGNMNPPSVRGLGGNSYSDETLAPVLTQPRGIKQQTNLDTWADTAYVLALRAKKAAQFYGKKDFNALYRLVLSASIALDKAYPQQLVASGGNLIVQLFGSLGSDAAKAILEPQHPTLIDVTPDPAALPSAVRGISDEDTLPPVSPAIDPTNSPS